MGTVIVEFSQGRTILEEILQSDTYMKSIADALVLVAKKCKFEGWLLNIECDLNGNKITQLKEFAEYLTVQMHKAIPASVVFWYDSIINTGHLSWQNELNNKNKLFFDACDGILINYTWDEKNLQRTAEAVFNQPEMLKNIFIGIDVFGRGQVAKFQSNVVCTLMPNL